MKYCNLKLKNYKRIYNGIGKDFVNINFHESKKVVLTGPNGCGKTTIMKALSPLPDSSSEIIEGKEGEKSIIIRDNDTTYVITYVYPLKSNGTRDTTKGYIKKTINFVDYEELNSSGNITECKNLIYDLFSLDPNFITLSQLSSEDRGLADKKPAERKEFISKMLDDIKIYNDIYKTLSKRSSTFKSIVNSLNMKLSSLGDINNLVQYRDMLVNNKEQLENEKNSLIMGLGVLNEKVSGYDNVLKEHNDLKAQLESIKNSINELEAEKNQYAKMIANNNIQIQDIGKLKKIYDESINKMSMMGSIVSEKTVALNNIVAKLNKAREVTSHTQTQIDDNLKSLYNSYKLLEDRINTVYRGTHAFRLNSTCKLTCKLDIEIQTRLLEYYKTISDFLSVFPSGTDGDITFKSIIDNYAEGEEYGHIPSKFIDDLKDVNQSISDINTENSDLQKELNNITDDIGYLITQMESHNNINSNDSTTTYEYKKGYDNLVGFIRSKNNDNVDGYEDIESMIENGDIPLIKIRSTIFNIIDQIRKTLDYINDKNKLDKIKDDISIWEEEAIAYADNNIDKLNEEYEEAIKDIANVNNDFDKLKQDIDHKKSMLDVAIKTKEYNEKIEQLEKEISLKQLEYDDKSIEVESYADILKELSLGSKKLQELKNNIQLKESQLKDISENLSNTEYSIKMIMEYTEEMNLYNDKYNKVECLKKYSSPNSGIQIVFIELYMNKILSIANELLTLVFDGNFSLLPFVINEKEFRIPCTSSVVDSLPIDDISSMSTAQLSIISMVISFAILFHSSTKYNILKLDEIDGALDQENRRNFGIILDRLTTMLETEQCIIISHNLEVDLENNVQVIDISKL